MGGHTLIDDRPEIVRHAPEASSSIQDLAQHLVRQVLEHTSPADSLKQDSEGREILLDTEFDGIRCLLLRTPYHSEHAPIVLSPRELEIARMVAEGFPTKTIAAVLDISSWTVSTYLRRIFAKLGVSSRAAMVERLHQEGIRTNVPSPTYPSSLLRR